jgi:hypothetical protein
VSQPFDEKLENEDSAVVEPAGDPAAAADDAADAAADDAADAAASMATWSPAGLRPLSMYLRVSARAWRGRMSWGAHFSKLPNDWAALMTLRPTTARRLKTCMMRILEAQNFSPSVGPTPSTSTRAKTQPFRCCRAL